MNTQKCKIIFLLGHMRSGTALLKNILSAHPDITFISNEFNDLPFYYKNQCLYDKYGKRKFEIMGKDFFDHRWIEARGETRCARSFKDWVEEICRYYQEQDGKPIIGIKIAAHIAENVQMIKEIFPDACCIHIIRDPRDVFLSTKKTTFGTKSPFYLGKSWASANTSIASLKNTMPHYHAVLYEELIQKTEETLQPLCHHLHLEYEQKMLQFYRSNTQLEEKHKQLLKHPIQSDNCNKWKIALSKKDLRFITLAANHIMLQYGYSDAHCEDHISRSERIGQYLYDKVKTTLNIWKITHTQRKMDLLATRIKRRFPFIPSTQ